jgi:threonylcarbamoyladenosine tRNA methylthiotransferase CDKAL1
VTERDYSGQLRDLSGKKVAILTFGCTFNQGDTRIMEHMLTDLGCSIVISPDEADAVVVNTCNVIAATERKMLRVLRTLRERPLYVTGCMALTQRDEILSVCTPVFLSPPSRAGTCRGSSTGHRYDVGIVQMGSGCPGSCSYCITRLARGPLKSYPGHLILEEIHAAVRSGTAEVRLTSQDCSAWGQDTGESLPVLINRIGEIPGTFRVRLGMMNPATILPVLDPLTESIGNRNLFRFAHIPVQSGSDHILRKMGRKYTADDVIGIVSSFRRRNPDITIATDIIVGFPGEEEEDVQATLDLLGRMLPAKINITRYSPRPGTPAATLKAPLDRVKKERSRSIQRHAMGIYQQLNRSLIGSSHQVLVTERIKPGTVLARTDSYTGIVLHHDLQIGSELTARITEDRTYFFLGEPCG